MTFVSDASLPLPGMPDSAPALPAFQMTLIGQPQPVRIPERLWRSWLDDAAVVSHFEPKRYRRRNQCWPWIGGVSSTGHGSFRAASLPGPSRRGTVPAHLFAYQLEYGVISRLGWSNTDDEVLCHQCDFAGCTNPAHMRLGTNRSNRSEYELRRRDIARTWTSTRSKSASLRPRLQDVRSHSGSDAAALSSMHICGEHILLQRNVFHQQSDILYVIGDAFRVALCSVATTLSPDDGVATSTPLWRLFTAPRPRPRPCTSNRGG